MLDQTLLRQNMLLPNLGKPPTFDTSSLHIILQHWKMASTNPIHVFISVPTFLFIIGNQKGNPHSYWFAPRHLLMSAIRSQRPYRKRSLSIIINSLLLMESRSRDYHFLCDSKQQVNDIISDKWIKSIISRSKTNLFSSNQYHLSRRESTFFLYLFPNSKYRGKLSIACTSFLSFITKAFSNYVFYWIFFALFRIRIRLPVTDNTLFSKIVVEILAVSARTLGLICTKIGDTIKRLEQICH